MLTEFQINARLTALERMITSVKPGRERKDLPGLIAAYNRLLEHQGTNDDGSPIERSSKPS